MAESFTGRTRPAWIVAQDPGVRTDTKVLMARVEIIVHLTTLPVES